MFIHSFSDMSRGGLLDPRLDITTDLDHDTVSPLYVGAGTSMTLAENRRSLTEEAIEFISATDRHDIKTGWVGANMPQNILGMITNTPYLLTALTGTSHI